MGYLLRRLLKARQWKVTMEVRNGMDRPIGKMSVLVTAHSKWGARKEAEKNLVLKATKVVLYKK